VQVEAEVARQRVAVEDVVEQLAVARARFAMPTSVPAILQMKSKRWIGSSKKKSLRPNPMPSR
jgi:hypothetical protein